MTRPPLVEAGAGCGTDSDTQDTCPDLQFRVHPTVPAACSGCGVPPEAAHLAGCPWQRVDPDRDQQWRTETGASCRLRTVQPSDQLRLCCPQAQVLEAWGATVRVRVGLCPAHPLPVADLLRLLEGVK